MSSLVAFLMVIDLIVEGVEEVEGVEVQDPESAKHESGRLKLIANKCLFKIC